MASRLAKAMAPQWYTSGMAGEVSPTNFDDIQAAAEVAALERAQQPYREVRPVRSRARAQEPMPEGLPPTAVGTLASAADPLGIPSWAIGKLAQLPGMERYEGAREDWRAIQEADPSGQIFGALAPVPGGGPILQGIGTAGRVAAAPILAAIKRAPKTLGAVLGIGGAGAVAAEAGEGSKEAGERAGEYDAEIAELRSKIARSEERRDALKDAEAPEAPKPTKLAANATRSQIAAAQRRDDAALRAHEQAVKRAGVAQEQSGARQRAITEEIAKDQERLRVASETKDKIAAEARKRLETERPLVEQNPIYRSLPLVGAALAAGSAYVPRLRQVMGQQKFAEELAARTLAAEKAVTAPMRASKGRGFSEADAKTALSMSQLREFEKAAAGVPAGKGGEILGPALTGTALSAEGALLPYQLDYASQGAETAAGKAARERFFTPEGWFKTALASTPGTSLALAGAHLPTYKRPAAMDADLARARGALATFDERRGQGVSRLRAAMTPEAPILTRESVAAGRVGGSQRAGAQTVPQTPEEVAATLEMWQRRLSKKKGEK